MALSGHRKGNQHICLEGQCIANATDAAEYVYAP